MQLGMPVNNNNNNNNNIIIIIIITLRKHAYSNMLKILPPKNETIQIKNSDIFHISAQNIDCGYSLEPPWQSMSLSRNKKNNVYTLVNPSFTI